MAQLRHTHLLRVFGLLGGLGLVGCGGGTGSTDQLLDISEFATFTFTRTITDDPCLDAGTLFSVELSSQLDNRLFTYTELQVSEEADTECVGFNEGGACLTATAAVSRVLSEPENAGVDETFARVTIASTPNEVCGAGNVNLCTEDTYEWDGLALSGNFCQPVHIRNSGTLVQLFGQLRDGLLATPTDSGGGGVGTGGTPDLDDLLGTIAGDVGSADREVSVLRVESIIASDQLLGKNGDFAILRNQSDLDGVLLQDGATAIDFENEIGIAVVILRGPCQEFNVQTATDSLLTVDVEATLTPRADCFLDLGSIDAHLIVLTRTTKAVRVLLNGSVLDLSRL